MAVSRQEQYYNYILGVSNDFSSLPVAVTKHDGELYRLCEIRRDSGYTALRNAIDRVINDSRVYLSQAEISEVLTG